MSRGAHGGLGKRSTESTELKTPQGRDLAAERDPRPRRTEPGTEPDAHICMTRGLAVRQR